MGRAAKIRRIFELCKTVFTEQLRSNPTDMRKGREGLAGIVREVMGHNPKCYNEAFF